MIMLIGWFAVRVVYFGWVGLKLVSMQDQILSIQTVCWLLFVFNYVAAYALQLIWFKKILMGALKVLGVIKAPGASRKDQ
jgi:hypothetical protein